MRSKILAVTVSVLALGATAACGGGSGSSGALNAKGPIKIWLSDNPQEITWGKAMVKEWNAGHPKEQVTAQQIPAGKTSEEVIGAAIAAGNAPCLVYNTSPASVPQWTKEGGLVPLNKFPGGKQYIESRTGASAKQYQASDGNYYQIPWKSNPVMIFYNKKLFKKAGISTTNPPLSTYSQFLATSRKLVKSGVSQAAIWPSPTSEFFQPWFDFYPLYAAATHGTPLLENGKATFDDAAGKGVANFWASMYKEGLAPKEAYNGDSFADQKAAMAIVGPWAIAVYKSIDWGVVPVPTPDGMSASQTHTFSDAKNVAIYSACKNQGTAWDLLKFSTSKAQDGKLLDMTGQMPLRQNLEATYPSYFQKNPEYKLFASEAARTTEVPNVSNSIAIWQNFRDQYSSAVIFGKTPVDTALSNAASKANQLAGQS